MPIKIKFTNDIITDAKFYAWDTSSNTSGYRIMECNTKDDYYKYVDNCINSVLIPTNTFKELQKFTNEADAVIQNLVRINKERSNAARGLVPKKKHSGYTFKGSTKTKLGSWVTTLETPYRFDTLPDIAERLIARDLYYEKKLEHLGIKGWYEVATEKPTMELMKADYELYKLKDEEHRTGIDIKRVSEMFGNVVYEDMLRQNGRGMWEVCITHTEPICRIDNEMRGKNFVG